MNIQNNEFYTNAHLRGNNIFLRGYLDGKRFKQVIPYKPYLFVPSPQNKKTEYKNLEGHYVSKMPFDNIKDAREFFNTYSDVENFKIYGLEKFLYTFISDSYPGEVHYDSSIIKVWIIDIEVASDDGFPNIQDATKEITAISCRFDNKTVVYGCGNYIPHRKDILYVKCRDEKDLLRKFLDLWNNEEFGPDVVTGWNIERFDIPYMVNRISKILGDEEAKRLSPWKILYEKEIEWHGKPVQTFNPVGISVLDYYELYRKFTYNQQESYTLDHIAFIETGKRKLSYEEYGSLNELYKQDFQKFIEYNVTDTDRVADIDDKMKLIELVYAMAYDAKINYVDALTSVLLWDIIVYNYLKEKNVVIPQNKSRGIINEFIPGGHVKEPVPGLYKWVLSFDLTSLYPSLIQQYNIGPETHVTKRDLISMLNALET